MRSRHGARFAPTTRRDLRPPGSVRTRLQLRVAAGATLGSVLALARVEVRGVGERTDAALTVATLVGDTQTTEALRERCLITAAGRHEVGAALAVRILVSVVVARAPVGRLGTTEALDVAAGDRTPTAAGAERHVEGAVELAELLGLTADGPAAAHRRDVGVRPGRVARQRTAL